jgi:hypothetical protein
MSQAVGMDNGSKQERSHKLQITCYNCKTIFELPKASMRSAKLKYALGHKEYTFTCPNCGAKNGLTADEFHSQDHPQVVVPVTGAQAAPEQVEDTLPSRTNETATRAPTNPVEGPDPEAAQRRQAVVRVRGVEARRDHSIWSEVMGSFSQGERITILDTWSDGEDTWVQLGPERWVNIEQDGESVIELIE